MVVHAGDWVSVELLDALQARARRLVGVFGNNDGPQLRARLPEVARVELAGVRLAVVHETGAAAGRERRCAAAYPDVDVLVFGHSHIPWDTTDGNRAAAAQPRLPHRPPPPADAHLDDRGAGRPERCARSPCTTSTAAAGAPVRFEHERHETVARLNPSPGPEVGSQSLRVHRAEPEDGTATHHLQILGESHHGGSDARSGTAADHADAPARPDGPERSDATVRLDRRLTESLVPPTRASEGDPAPPAGPAERAGGRRIGRAGRPGSG